MWCGARRTPGRWLGGDFTATSPAARFSTGGGVFSRCLSIPADDHSARENLQFQAAPNTTSTAEFSVLDDHGKQVCSIYPSLSTWTTCDLAPGVAHTVLVTGHDSTAEYTLSRRDVTATARGCTANPATEVGGPSTGGALGAPGELLCRQVTTGDAKDTLHLDVRDALGTANIVVTVKPTISGTAKVGRTLTAGHGTWTPAPTSYAYQWYANGKAIAGATKSSLTLKSAQSGQKVTVKVTARRTGHASGSATSSATKAVAR